MCEAEVSRLVELWLEIDPNAETRSEISNLYAAKEYNELRRRLAHRITFGTAGLRSSMEAGFNRMNDVTVLQASQGLAEYIKTSTLKLNAAASSAKPTVVIGHDHRHHSKRFGDIAVSIFLLAGFKVYYLEDGAHDLVTTPMVPFAIDYLTANGGIMITASHNPAKDNGYKVYWSNACQIIPPHDKNISLEISQNLTPVKNAWKIAENISYHYKKGNLIYNKDLILEQYYKKLSGNLIFNKNINGLDNLPFIYTPMHGVGKEFALGVFNNVLNISSNVHFVDEQSLPDPSFPTVSFPNPEEKGALDLAIEIANKKSIDIIVANDPDADRFSAAVRIGDTHKFHQLTGNELGCLFANFIIENLIEKSTNLKNVYLLNSTVSSEIIGSMSQKLGFNFTDTLTGFKWIGNKAIELEEKGYLVPFGYEEAIGFMFNNVHDKDGIAALTVFLQLINSLVQKGTNVLDKLSEIYNNFGFFKEFNGYYKLKDISLIAEIFGNIRKFYNYENFNVGNEIIGNNKDFKIVYWRDLTIGFETNARNNCPLLPVDPSSQMITCILKPVNPQAEDEHIRLTCRGSGTEPKLKIYIEGKSDSEGRAKDLSITIWKLLKQEWFKPSFYNITEHCADY
ncbi:phosphoribomutase PRM15 ASCRUDRAFT_5625 [Ascoidea rubescens DSM 1968]|uniref:Phosphoglucomutase, first 3 domain-containing protein n=1 Tax=Ascoidea rubescens DSM 1968 TaxID=1344418 RepID=A0A1D2VQ13_9ASCO|nr:hypothetical protein ASCRUDRAFT_5625 [Ascoidea rubescens DSM 1968]ODV63674.1 hypothetical protein ASCRUDRAFT_5625 [Ascoidea rubescens DSM 1968]